MNSRPSRPSRSRNPLHEVLKIVIGGTVGVVLALIVLRAMGIPIFGGSAGSAPDTPIPTVAKTQPQPRVSSRANRPPLSMPAAGSDGAASFEMPPLQNSEETPGDPSDGRTELGKISIKNRPPISGHTGSIIALAVSPNNQMLVTGSEDKNMAAWQIATAALSDRVDCVARSFAFSPSGQFLAAAVDQQIDLWVLEKEIKHPLEGHQGTVRAVAFSPTGDALVSCSDDSTLRFWDPAALRETGAVKLDSKPLTVAWSPAGDAIAVGCEDHRVRIFSPSGRSGVMLTGCSGRVLALAFGGTGRLAAADSDGQIVIWDLMRPEQPAVQFQAHKGSANALAWQPGTDLLASAGDDQIALWSGRSGKKLANIGGHKRPVRALAFAPSGEFFVSAGDDHLAVVWDVTLEP
ncbi:WD40 repeat domain-containing protein [Lignipirellula cremea]|uniref:WD domain, G-beta repeat n=1 Tax=Lignipirellula cremea TaxID=2528010 RepID=A0A518DNZ2_9BACT|nr:WD40 repeat domain-containing protein [Lignipirellula cremea]QDU93557.1 WD domain, G-beta repeat [Lignipirellula cremea]